MISLNDCWASQRVSAKLWTRCRNHDWDVTLQDNLYGAVLRQLRTMLRLVVRKVAVTSFTN